LDINCTWTTFFPSPNLYDDLAQKKIFYCGTVRLHRKGMPKDLKPKTLRLKRGDIRVRTRGDLTAVAWKGKRDVCLLTNPKQRRCRMCSVRDVTQTVLFKCVKCDVALCVDRSCFEDYHTKKQPLRHLFVRSPWKLLQPRPECKLKNMNFYNFFF